MGDNNWLAVARIAELEARNAHSLSERQRLRKEWETANARVAELEALFKLDGEQHAAAVNAARHEQDARLGVYKARIAELEAALAEANAIIDWNRN